MFERILVPLDGSTASFNAFDWAVEIALPRQAVITALCVIDVRVSHESREYLPILDEINVSDEYLSPAKVVEAYQAWAENVINYAQNRGAAVHVRITPEIVNGIPYKEIISRSPEYDLLVMSGWQTSGDYPGPFLAGSTFLRVATHTDLPILHPFSEPQKSKDILVVYEDTPGSANALQLAANWAKTWGARLVLLTIQSNGNQAQALLRQACQAVEPLTPQLVVSEGEEPAAAVIRKIAAQHQCDLVSMGISSHHLWQNHSLGTALDNLLDSGSLSLLLSH